MPSTNNPRRRMLAKSAIVAALFSLIVIHPARTEEKTDAAIETMAGKEFSISLESNRTTGYGWQLAKPLDETMVKSVKNEYLEARHPKGAAPLVGSGGKEVWTFKAVKAGKTTIDFKYVRPWEKDQPPAQTRSIPVVITATTKP